MNEIDLCQKIKESLKQQGINVSSSEISELYANTLSTMNSMLDEDLVIDINNFGSFWRKRGTSTSSFTFFKPIDKLTDRIK